MNQNHTLGNPIRKTRNSSIELLKIAAIFLIIISHVVQTISSENTYITYQNYVLDISTATTNPQILMLAILRYCGALGNTIFFVCSAWFLLDKKTNDKKKWWILLVEIWSVSVILLFLGAIILRGEIPLRMALECLAPTTFSLNWYMTCYLIFYLLYPALNLIIDKLNQRQHLLVSAGLFFMYFCANFVIKGLFFMTNLMVWIAIYFAIAYMKRYLQNLSSNAKINAAVFILSLIGHICLLLATNILGLRTEMFQDKLLFWLQNANPFLFLLAISLFHLCRNIHWNNRFVNRFSSLSLLIYIIHENLLVRTYLRPIMLQKVYERFGYDYILLWVVLISVVILIVSTLAGLLYEQTIFRLVKRAASAVYQPLKNMIYKLTDCFMKLR